MSSMPEEVQNLLANFCREFETKFQRAMKSGATHGMTEVEVGRIVLEAAAKEFQFGGTSKKDKENLLCFI